MSEATKYKFGVISGTNKGAFIPIKNGVYSLGKSDSCDLILSDEHINDHHINIEISSTLITLFNIGNETHINKRKITNESHTLNPFDVITIGSSSFTIVPSETKWSEILNQTNHINSPTNSITATQKSLAKPIPYSILIAPTVIIALLIIGLLVPVQAIVEEKSTQELLEKLIEKHKLHNSIQLNYDESNILYIGGYIDNHIVFNKFIDEANHISQKVDIRIKNTSDITAHAYNILRSLNILNITLQPLKSGEINAQGYVKNLEKWKYAKNIVKNDITGLQKIHDQHVFMLSEITSYIKDLIATSSLKEWVYVDTKYDNITLSGKIPDQNQQEWKKIIYHIKNKYKKAPDITDNVTITKNHKILLPIKSVSMGEIPCVTLKNDKKYIVGSTIKDGYSIKSIFSEKIVIQDKSGNIFNFFVGELGA